MNNHRANMRVGSKVITWGFVVLLVCMALLSAINGDFRLLLAEGAFVAILFILKYFVAPINIGKQIENKMQKKKKIISGILFVIFLLFLLTIFVFNYFQ